MKIFNLPKVILSISIISLSISSVYAKNKYEGYTTQECMAANLSKSEEDQCFNQASSSSSEETIPSIEMQTTGNMGKDSELVNRSDYLTKGESIVRLCDLAKSVYREQMVNGNNLVILTNSGYLSNGDKYFKYLETYGVRNKWIGQLVSMIMFNAIKISTQYQQDPLWSRQEVYDNLIYPILDKLMINELKDRGFDPSDYINQ